MDATPLSSLVWNAGHYTTGKPVWTADVQHGILDEKGRQVGGQAAIYQVPDEDGFGPRWRGRWALHIFASRDGEGYGAYPHGSAYDSLELAQAAAPAKLAAQRRRYTVKYAGQERVVRPIAGGAPEVYEVPLWAPVQEELGL